LPAQIGRNGIWYGAINPPQIYGVKHLA